MNKALPDKWIRKAVSDAINNITIDDNVIPCFDYRVTPIQGETPDYYVLMTTQTNEVDKGNKCEYLWDSEILLDVNVRYYRSGNIGSRLLADDILDEVRNLTQNLQLDVASGLEIDTLRQSFPNDLNFVSENEIIYRKFIRLILKIK
jgi:hypothetical protein